MSQVARRRRSNVFARQFRQARLRRRRVAFQNLFALVVPQWPLADSWQAAASRRADRWIARIEPLEDRRMLAIDPLLLADIGISTSDIREITPVGDQSGGANFFFVANTADAGHELWKSDGTAAGTVLVKDIRAGNNGSFPSYLTNVGGTLFFSADDGIHGHEPWILAQPFTTDVSLSGGVLAITDVSGGNTDDTLTIVVNGLYVRVSDPINLVGAGAGAIQVDANTVDVPLASITGNIQVNTLGGNDVLTVSFAGGNFTTAIAYDGGSPVSGAGDSLTITGGGPFASVTHTFTTASSGTIDVAGNSQISYTGLEPVTDNLSATNRTFAFTGGTETITLTDATGANMTIDSTLGESVTFANPTGMLTINAGTGDDVINIQGVDGAYAGGLTINGGADIDTVNFQTTATTLLGGSISVSGEAIHLNADLRTNGGNVSLSASGTGVSGSGSIVNGSATSMVVTIDQAGSTTYSGLLGGPAGGAANDKNMSLVKQGTGTLTLGAANTYTGKTSILGGILSVNADSRLGTPPASPTPDHLVLSSGATLLATSSFTLTSNRGIAVGPTSGSGTGTIALHAGVNLKYGGIIANNAAGTGGLRAYPRTLAARNAVMAN